MTNIILGPPGTGKTTRLIGEVKRALAAGVSPERVGYVSFTRRAADEAVTRASEEFGLSREDLRYFRTLHSLCYQQLGLRRGDVLEDARTQEFARYAGVKITGARSEDGSNFGFERGDRMMHMVNLARIRMVPLREQYDLDDDGLPWSELRTFDAALRAFKDEHQVVDYTDMLELFARRGARPRLDELMVDEGQDLSRLQWLVVAELAKTASRVTVAGDDDQAIYRWAGADVDQLIGLAGSVEVLGQSWRVPPVLQRLAGGIIGGVARRRPKEWRPREGGAGVLDYAPHLQQAVDRMAPDGEVLFLARNTYLLRDRVAPLLRDLGVPYEWRGQSSLRASAQRAVKVWEALRRGEAATAQEARLVYSEMSSGRGVARGHKQLAGLGDDEPVTLADLKERGGLLREDPWHQALDRLSKAEVAALTSLIRRGGKLGEKSRVRLSTIHGAKGAQADHVVLLREVAPRTHREAQLREDDERRVWYVAVTRAKQRLTVVEGDGPLSCQWV